MVVRRAKFFKSKQKYLRPSQKKSLDQAIRTILNEPTIGIRGEEEIEDFFFFDYIDNFGKMRIAYTLIPSENDMEDILLISLSQISIKI